MSSMKSLNFFTDLYFDYLIPVLIFWKMPNKFQYYEFFKLTPKTWFDGASSATDSRLSQLHQIQPSLVLDYGSYLVGYRLGSMVICLKVDIYSNSLPALILTLYYSRPYNVQMLQKYPSTLKLTFHKKKLLCWHRDSNPRASAFIN